MLAFHQLFQKIFTSFDIGKDTTSIERLDNEGVHACMIIKRSWIYGAFLGLYGFPIIGLFAINIGLLLWAFPGSPIYLTICALLIADCIYLGFEYTRYVVYFRRVYGAIAQIVRPHTIRYESEEGNEIFSRIFNHICLSIIFLVALMIVTLAAQIYVPSNKGIFVAGVNAVVFLLQISILWGFVRRLMHLEMDFTIVIPGKIWFFNQTGFYADSKVIDADKIKSVTGSISSFLASFFGYGKLDILLEGDALGVINLDFIGNPEKTAERVDILLSKDEKRISEATLGFLDTVLLAVGVKKKDLQTRAGKEKIRAYLLHFQDDLKSDFEASSEMRKKEIRETYEQFM